MNKFSGHAYGELIEYDASGKKIANCRVTCWKYKVFEIKSIFKKITGKDIDSGLKVRLRLKLTFSEIYGFSANIIDIDPKFTLGDLFANLQEIINQLTAAKLINKNNQLSSPFDFFNVAVISSPTAAGLEDFKQVADQLLNTGLCKFHYIDAIMQGQQCSQSVISALDIATKIHSEQLKLDCIIILRGGGSVIDLASFNDYQLAAKICEIEIPVFCAIGHEKDQCIIDIIANKSFGTPSKVANYIFETIIMHAKEVIKNTEKIHKKVEEILTSATLQVNFFLKSINQSINYRLENAISSIENLNKSIQVDALDKVKQAKDCIKKNYKLILANSIEPTLQKGYAIALQKNEVVTTKKQADLVGIDILRFKDGDYNYGKAKL